MTIRWLLVGSLTVCSLLIVGCNGSDAETGADPKAPKQETQASRDAKKNLEAVKTSLAKARDSIKKAQDIYTASAKQPANTPQRLAGNPSPSPPDHTQAAEQIKTDITAATTELGSVESKLGDLENALAAQSAPEKNNEHIHTVRKSVSGAVDALASATVVLANITQNSPEDRSEVNQSLKKAFELVDSTAPAALKSITISDDLEELPGWWDSMTGIGFWVAIVIGSILALLLLLATGRALINSTAARAEARIKNRIQPLASAMQKQQAEVASQIADLTTSQTELHTRIADLEFEIKKVARVARDAANDGAGRRPPDPVAAFSSFADPGKKDEPVFPIAIGDYLSKMRSSSNIVRPDFQNDILVSDPGGTGELVLIRDAAMPDDLQPLFVVPRATQFQTKQDFYTYYQKYYECARPSAGDVWIIDPAVVSKVSGGWQLREKGVLEIR
jgi:phage shock protein A